MWDGVIMLIFNYYISIAPACGLEVLLIFWKKHATVFFAFKHVINDAITHLISKLFFQLQNSAHNSRFCEYQYKYFAYDEKHENVNFLSKRIEVTKISVPAIVPALRKHDCTHLNFILKLFSAMGRFYYDFSCLF